MRDMRHIQSLFKFCDHSHVGHIGLYKIAGARMLTYLWLPFVSWSLIGQISGIPWEFRNFGQSATAFLKTVWVDWPGMRVYV